MLKASWGGGGRGMRVIESDAQLTELLPVARREAKAGFGNDEVYLEKLVRKARHIEVQILGDTHGNLVHLFERDCTVQRRNQKVVERAPAAFLTDAQRAELCGYALQIGRAVKYRNAGTVEFLQDAETGKFYFIEVNPRIQVEHTVTEAVTNIDLVKAQIRIADGAKIGDEASGVPAQEDIHLTSHALQCRVTTEDPENGFSPDYGKITAYRSPAGFGIRLDAGTAYAGAILTRSYDSMLVKVTAWAPNPVEAIARMHRALWEFRIRGVATNLRFLDQVITHPKFAHAEYTTKFIDETPELFKWEKKRDRATRILSFIGETIVNGNPEVKGRLKPKSMVLARLPKVNVAKAPPPGTKQKLDELGAEGFAKWMLAQERVLITDTTMRDAHQSLLATRMRQPDMTAIAPYYAHMMPQLFSMECWGGATFDVAMRFLREDPWSRLEQFRAAMPNLLLQMLLRSANAVGYTNYPDNVVRAFVKQAATSGVDVFRVFDSLNWVENMRVAIDAVLETGKLCEAAICYTGNLSSPKETKYTLDYYLKMGRELKAAGTHILGIKDMAGLCQPSAAYTLVKALKDELGMPVHFHTHDTSGIAAASVLAAVAAGVRCGRRRGGCDERAHFAAQPRLHRRGAALRRRATPASIPPNLRAISMYWEQVRKNYLAFESDIRSGASEVYVHGMPGGQYTNLKEQARSRRPRRFALARGVAGLRRRQPDVRQHREGHAVVESRRRSRVDDGLERHHQRAGARSERRGRVPRVRGADDARRSRSPGGRLARGHPEEGAQGREAADRRARARRCRRSISPAERKKLSEKLGRAATDTQFASYLMYPKVFLDYASDRVDVWRLRHPADAGVFLRHGAGRRSQRRHRARQDAHRALRRAVRSARRRHAPGVLRAQRPAALHRRHGSLAGGQAAAAAKDGSRAMPSTSARRCRAPSRP